MAGNLFHGQLVRLVAADPQKTAEAISKWSRDSEYWRLMDSSTTRPLSVKKVKEWIEKDLDQNDPDLYWFLIHTLADDRLIGEIGLDKPQWNHGEAYVGISIGEREYWGKGYGTDAMDVILRYAFQELNLQRVTLNVFDYNPRAIRSYEKAGFKHEGRVRQRLLRENRRWDLVHMGILREEWEETP